MTRLLLERDDVNINSMDPCFRTPLFWAAINGHEEVVKVLLDSGRVDPNAKDADDLTPYLWAAGGGHDAVVKLLRPSDQHSNIG